MAATDLTTLDAVRRHLQLTGEVTEQDPVIEDIIARLSVHIARKHCQREFAPAEDAGTRVIELDEGFRLQSLAPFDARAVTSVVLDEGYDTERTLSSSEWRLALLDPHNSVWTAVRLTRPLCGSTLTLTGNWGYSEIPAHVEEACILAVVSSLRSDVQAFGGALQPNSFGDGVNDDQALPPGVRGLLAGEVRAFYR
jgi:hypothetical protein